MNLFLERISECLEANLQRFFFTKKMQIEKFTLGRNLMCINVNYFELEHGEIAMLSCLLNSRKPMQTLLFLHDLLHFYNI